MAEAPRQDLQLKCVLTAETDQLLAYLHERVRTDTAAGEEFLQNLSVVEPMHLPHMGPKTLSVLVEFARLGVFVLMQSIVDKASSESPDIG